MIAFLKALARRSARAPAREQRSVHDLSVFAPGSPLTELIPKPAIAQEQFADSFAAEQQRQEQITSLYRRVVAGNNRAVTRNYGQGDVDETTPAHLQKKEYREAQSMAPQDWDDLGALKTQVHVTEGQKARIVPLSPEHHGAESALETVVRARRRWGIEDAS